jgi:hypothetical protein
MSDNIGLQLDPPKGVTETITALTELVTAVNGAEKKLNNNTNFGKLGIEEALAKLPKSLGAVATALKAAMYSVNQVLTGGNAETVDIVRSVNRAIQQVFEQRLAVVGTMTDREIASWRKYGVSINGLQKAQLADNKANVAALVAARSEFVAIATAADSRMNAGGLTYDKARDTAEANAYKNRLAQALIFDKSREAAMVAAAANFQNIATASNEKMLSQAMIFDKARDAQLARSYDTQLAQALVYDRARDAQMAKSYETQLSQALLFDKARDAQIAKSYEDKLAQALLYDKARDAQVAKSYETQLAQALTYDRARDAQIAKAYETKLAQALIYDKVRDAQIAKSYETQLAQAMIFDKARDAQIAKSYETRLTQALAFDKARDAQLAKSYETQLAQALIYDKARDAQIAKSYETRAAQALAYDKARDAQIAKSYETRMAKELAAIKMQEELDKLSYEKRLAFMAKFNAAVANGKAFGGINFTSMEAAISGISRGFGGIATTIAHLIPFVTAFVTAATTLKTLKVGAEFEQSLFVIKELAGNSTEEVKGLSDSMLELSKTGVYGPLQMAKGLEILTLAGLNAKDAFTALQPTLNFSLAGGVNLDAAASTLVAVATAYGYSAEAFSTVGDMIAKTAADSMASVQGLTESFKAASVVAQLYGVSLEDTSYMLKSLAQIGIQGSAAGTSVRNFYTEITKQSGKAFETLKKLKVEIYDTEGLKSTLEIFKELALSMDNLDKRSKQAAMAALTNERGGKTGIGVMETARTDIIKELNKQEREHNQLTGENITLTTTATLSLKQLSDGYDSLIAKQKKFAKEAAGFTFLAALENQLTTMGSYKGLLASLEGDFARAFGVASDSVFLLSVELRKALNSDEFNAALQTLTGALIGMATSFAKAVSYINTNTTETVAAVAILGTVFTAVGIASNAAAIGIDLATISLTGVSLAIEGTTVQLGVMNTVFALGPGKILLLIASIGLLVYEIGKIAGAWVDAESARDKALRKEKEATETSIAALRAKADQTKSSMEAELERLTKSNQLRSEGATQHEADQKLFGEAAKSRIEQLHKENLSLIAKRSLLEEIQLLETNHMTVDAGGNTTAAKSVAEIAFEVSARQAKAIAAETAAYQAEITAVDALVEKLRLAYVEKARLDKVKPKPQGPDSADFPSGGRFGGGGKGKPDGTKSELESLIASIEKFNSVSDAMAESSKKATEAQTFEAGSMATLHKITNNYTGDKAKLVEVENSIAAAAERRKAIQADNSGASYIASLQNLNNELDKQVETHAKLTAAEKIAEASKKGLQEGTIALTYWEKVYAEALMDRAKALEKLRGLEAQAAKAGGELKTATSNAKVYMDTLKQQLQAETELEAARDAAIQKGPQFVARLEAETAARSKNAGSIVKLTEKIDALKLKERELKAEKGVLSPEDLKTLKEAEDQLSEMTTDLDEIIKKAGELAEKKWLTIDRDRIAGDLAGAVMTGLTTGGQEGARALRDILVKEFITNPIQVWIKATISEIMGGSSTGNGLTNSSGGSLTGFKSVDSILGAANKMADTYLHGASKSLGGFATSSIGESLGLSSRAEDMMGNTMGNSLTTAGELFQAMPIGGMITAYTKGGASGFLQGAANIGISGAVTGGLAAASAGTGVAAGAMSGAGAALSAVPGWGWAIMAGLAILGNKGEYVKSTGASEQTFAQDGTSTIAAQSGDHPFGGGLNAGAEANASADKITTGMYNTYTDVAKALGIGVKDVKFSYGQNNSDGGKTSIGGGSYTSMEFKTSDEAIKLEASRAVLAALKDSDLPTYLSGMFDNIDLSALSQVDADRLMQDAKGFKAIADAADSLPFNSLTKASHATLVALTAASGGLDKLTSNLTSYYANYYTDAERNAKSTNSLGDEFKKLGLEMPKTKQAFRELVEAQDLTTESGRKAAAGLYTLNDVFAKTVVDTGQLALDAAIKAAEAATESMDITRVTASVLPATVREYTAYSKLLASGASITQRALNFDGSVAQATALSSSMQSMFSASLELVTQIKEQALVASETFAASRATVLLDTLSIDQKYAYWDSKWNTDMEALKTAIDPVDIKLLAADVNKSIMSGWALLTAEQKLGSRAEFDKLLADANTLVADRYDTAEGSVDTSTNEALVSTLSSVLADDAAARKATNAQLAEILRIGTSAIVEAAAVLRDAAAKPKQVEVTVTTQRAATSEVTYTGYDFGGNG